MIGLGIMNGTSLDGIDYALVETDRELQKLQFKDHAQLPIPPKLKAALIECANNKTTTYEVSALHYELGALYATQIKKLAEKWRWDVVGLHGQTVHHSGKEATLQIGHPGFIASQFTQPVYYDFRSADVIAGGEGAPFAPFFQSFILKQLPQKNVSFHNLGGISNLTYYLNNKIIAFDTGPANRLMDEWIYKKKKLEFDENGDHAAKGLPDPVLVREFLKHPYFAKKPPKSTGRELFNMEFIIKKGGSRFAELSFADQMSTLTELTVQSIVEAYRGLPQLPEAIYFYGGGVYNRYLMDRIQYHLPQTLIAKTDRCGWPTQAFEASLMAFLGLARHLNVKVHKPEVTGAQRQVALGACYN